MVIRRYISRWVLLFSGKEGIFRGGCYSLVVIRRYISRWLLLFSGNKKVYFEVVYFYYLFTKE